MPTLDELIMERRAKIDAFDYDRYDGRADLDVSALRRAIENTPVLSKADALAAPHSISLARRLPKGIQT